MGWALQVDCFFHLICEYVYWRCCTLDSKTLNAAARSSLLKTLCSDPANLAWSVRVLWCVLHVSNRCKRFDLTSYIKPSGDFERNASKTTNKLESPVWRSNDSSHSWSTSKRYSTFRGNLSSLLYWISLIRSRSMLTHWGLQKPMKHIYPLNSLTSVSLWLRKQTRNSRL